MQQFALMSQFAYNKEAYEAIQETVPYSLEKELKDAKVMRQQYDSKLNLAATALCDKLWDEGQASGDMSDYNAVYKALHKHFHTPIPEVTHKLMCRKDTIRGWGDWCEIKNPPGRTVEQMKADCEFSREDGYKYEYKIIRCTNGVEWEMVFKQNEKQK